MVFDLCKELLTFIMKAIFLPVFISLILSSCSIYNRVVEFSDSYKGLNGMRLEQNPIAYSAEKIGTVWGTKQAYSFVSEFQYEQTEQKRPEIFVDFRLNSAISFDRLDSVLYFNLDDEKIKLVAGESMQKHIPEYSATTSTTDKSGENGAALTDESGNSLVLDLRFVVPENLWVSIANASQIQYRFYKGKEGIDVKLNQKETEKLKYFFGRACTLRDAAFPAIPANPPGLKKW